DRYTSIENVTGSAFADTITGNGSDNVVLGGDGNDSLTGGPGNDSLDGGAGNDTLIGGTGADTLAGGAGTDFIDYSSSASGVTVDLAAGTGAGGDAEGDVLSGIEDVQGTAFDDTLSGDAGNNILTGGDGNDSLTGGAGNDTLLGGNGNDTLVGGAGADSLDGGGGTDRVDYSGSAAAINIDLKAKTGFGGDAEGDTLNAIEDAIGTAFDDTITGSDGANLLQGGAGDDSILGLKGDDTILGGAGADTIDGGDNADQIDYSGSDAAVNVNLGTGAASGGHAQGDVISNVEGVTGSAFDDTLSGSATNDTLVGGDGNDLFFGGAGNDSQLGGAGDDTFSGDQGNDTIDGGTGVDAVDYSGSSAAVAVDLAAGTGTGGDAQGDRYTSIENVTGSAFADTITGNGSDNLISGGAGGDLLVGGAGSDTVDYSDSASAVFVDLGLGFGSGGDANGDSLSNFENVIGSDFNDSLVGDGTDNQINGGAGDDTLIGGAGADALEGGVGLDVVDYSASASAVTVDLTSGTASGGDAQGDRLSGIEGVEGTDFDDALTGDASANTFDAGAGDDTVSGGLGGDTILGGDNNDTIDGGAGDDLIYGDQEAPPVPLADTIQYSYAQDSTGGQAAHYGEQGLGTENDPLNFIDGDLATESRYHDGDIVEYSFGQEIEAGTSITLTEGTGAEDGWVDVYVSIGSTDPNGDTLSGGGNGVGYENTVTNGQGILIYSGPSDSTVDLIIPINATHIQFVGVVNHGGWAEIELTDFLTPAVPGDDSITAGEGNDTVDGGAGNDFIDGGADNDSLLGGEGADSIVGGTGDDTIDGGAGSDSLTGGAGNDVFLVSAGNDTINDFNFGNSGALGDGDRTNNDYIDLAAFYDSLDELRADQADDGILNQSNAFDEEGNAVDYSDNAQFAANSLTLLGATASSFSYDNTGIVCFTEGTRILTPSGERAIERLQVGDAVCTMDNGAQPIVWIGCRKVAHAELQSSESLLPILIREGVLGAERDLLVSRQHGVLFGSDHLARAAHLAEFMPGVRVAKGKRHVTYIHIMFEAHQIIFAEGVPSESFYPGPMAMKMMAKDARRELETLFPQLGKIGSLEDAAKSYGATARPFMKRKALGRRLERDRKSANQIQKLPSFENGIVRVNQARAS
ncbi:Hint domain-containing protein, partial [Aestuariicoccus sp. MJ-SS9]|uniref:Hint domain-containing protein n=1 Tax=Aestuariicoccus sp. MJ-SS9 TaxID=3079855 RepID=UPI0029107CD7